MGLLSSAVNILVNEVGEHHFFFFTTNCLELVDTISLTKNLTPRLSLFFLLLLTKIKKNK